jgi:hypothetical protein
LRRIREAPPGRVMQADLIKRLGVAACAQEGKAAPTT